VLISLPIAVAAEVSMGERCQWERGVNGREVSMGEGRQRQIGGTHADARAYGPVVVVVAPGSVVVVVVLVAVVVVVVPAPPPPPVLAGEKVHVPPAQFCGVWAVTR
jgi:hypothetical protein